MSASFPLEFISEKTFTAIIEIATKMYVNEKFTKMDNKT